MATPPAAQRCQVATSQEFQSSYKEFEHYPTKLLPRTTHDHFDEELLDSYKSQVQDRQKSNEPLLLREQSPVVNNPGLLPKFIIRDISLSGRILKKTMLDDDRLVTHLLGQPQPLPSLPLSQQWTQKDPRCRFVYELSYIFNRTNLTTQSTARSFLGSNSF